MRSRRITYRNIKSYSDGSNEIKLEGWSKDRLISNVRFENITVNGEKLKKDEPLFTVNDYVKDIEVK